MIQYTHKAEIGLREFLRAKRSDTATVALDIQGHGKVKKMIGIINILAEVTPRILESKKELQSHRGMQFAVILLKISGL